MHTFWYSLAAAFSLLFLSDGPEVPVVEVA
jgi:hypothetical protein